MTLDECVSAYGTKEHVVSSGSTIRSIIDVLYSARTSQAYYSLVYLNPTITDWMDPYSCKPEDEVALVIKYLPEHALSQLYEVVA